MIANAHSDDSPTSSTPGDYNFLEMDLEDQLNTVDEKVKRVNKFVHELKSLSPVCEEAPDDLKEKQIFVRRIVQVSTEIQDAKDLILAICKPRVSVRQLELINSSTESDADPAIDPSVRFFGLDWQQIFGKCFSLSLNLQIFRTQAMDDGCSLDLVLLNTILKDLTNIEVDVNSHCEAVLHGRLSKSQQLLIQQEQRRFSSLAPPNPAGLDHKVAKSRSFRDTTGQKKVRQVQRYKKNKTTDFNKLTPSVTTGNISGHQNERDQKSIDKEWQEVLQEPRRKTSFIQNVSSIFKNIR